MSASSCSRRPTARTWCSLAPRERLGPRPARGAGGGRARPGGRALPGARRVARATRSPRRACGPAPRRGGEVRLRLGAEPVVLRSTVSRRPSSSGRSRERTRGAATARAPIGSDRSGAWPGRRRSWRVNSCRLSSSKKWKSGYSSSSRANIEPRVVVARVSGCSSSVPKRGMPKRPTRWARAKASSGLTPWFSKNTPWPPGRRTRRISAAVARTSAWWRIHLPVTRSTEPLSSPVFSTGRRGRPRRRPGRTRRACPHHVDQAGGNVDRHHLGAPGAAS